MQFQPPYKLRDFNLLDYTWRIYRANFVIFLQLSAAALLPQVAFQILSALGINLPQASETLVELVSSAWMLLPMLAIVIITENMMHQGFPLSFSQAIKQASSYWATAVGYTLLLGVVTAVIVLPLAFLTIPIPAVGWLLFIVAISVGIVSVYLQFVYQFIALRSDRRRSPLKRSWQLVKGQWWTVLGRNLVLGLAMMAISLVIFLPVMWLTAFSLATIAIIYSLFSILIYPVSSIYQTLLFFMLEARKGEASTTVMGDPLGLESGSQLEEPQKLEDSLQN